MDKQNKKPERKNAKASTVNAAPALEASVEGFSIGFGLGSGSGPLQVTRTQAGFINSVPSAQADHLLVGMMANQVESKMQYNRDQGRHGWHTEEISNDQLRMDLKNLVAKGDYIDAAIVSTMLMLREQLGLS